MKKYISVLIIILGMIFGKASAHRDFFLVRDFGNVKVRIKTGFQYEEINKIFMFGELAEKLSKELNYSEPIFLDFNHYYVGDCQPDFFISYDKGNTTYTQNTGSKKQDFLKDNSIVVRQVARQFRAQTTLKLLEYAILNQEKIKSTQKQIKYTRNYCDWEINTINVLTIKKILESPNSGLVNNLLQVQIYRPEKDFKDGVSYYFQNNRCFVFLRQSGKPDIVLMNVESIYTFERLENSSAIIFDSNSSFYYINPYNKRQVSQRQIIKNISETYQPFDVKDVEGDKLLIRSREEEKRIFIYLTKKDKLESHLIDN